MKYVINILFLFFLSSGFADNFYEKALKDAAISNGFKKPSEINSNFNKDKSKLGRDFFFEKMLSFNTGNTCSSCHLTKFSSADGLPNAIGSGATGSGIERLNSGGKIVPRNTLPLWGRGSKNFDTFFWDGKVTTIEGIVISQLGLLDRNYATRDGKYNINVKDNALLTAVHLPFVEIRELVQADEEIDDYLKKEDVGAAFDIYEKIAERVKADVTYSNRLINIYNIKHEDISFHHIADAITHFIKDEFSIKNTSFSKFIFEKEKLSKQEIEGGLIFYGKGKCATCHSGELLSDLKFYSIPFPQIGFGKNGFGIDYGKFNITFDPDDLYKFRTPPLYNVEHSFPYSHSGSVYDLDEAVIYHFDPLKLININELSNIDRNELYKKLAVSGDMIDSIPYLDDEEVSNLVKFLKTLSFIE
jgi:cytochrome c peroxidase